MDGAGRHFAPVAIIILTAFVMPIRPKDGTIYDGTAALNIQLRYFVESFGWESL
jgi:hypothetical protein